MLKRTRIPSKYTVSVLNTSKAEQHAVLFLIENGYDMNGARLKPEYAPLGIVIGNNGKHYLIDHEGCGTFIPLEDEKDEIYWCKDTYDENGNLLSIGCAAIVKNAYSLEELLEMPVEKTVPLHEFVRSFGDRLEQNYSNIVEFLSGTIDRKGNWIKVNS